MEILPDLSIIDNNGTFATDWNTTINSTKFVDTTVVAENSSNTMFSCLGWMVFFLYCVCVGSGRNVPSQEHWRGQDIRNRAQRNLQLRVLKAKKLEQSPKEREQLVDQCIYTQHIRAYDPETGQWTLGNVVDVEDTTSRSTNNSQISDDNTVSTSSSSDDINDVNQEQGEEDTCAICLEHFCVGDVVSWSRTIDRDPCSDSCQNSNENDTAARCPHVFHSDCIRPWLLHKRQDGCPSCRSTWLVPSPQQQQPQPQRSVEERTSGAPRSVSATTNNNTTATANTPSLEEIQESI